MLNRFVQLTTHTHPGGVPLKSEMSFTCALVVYKECIVIYWGLQYYTYPGFWSEMFSNLHINRLSYTRKLMLFENSQPIFNVLQSWKSEDVGISKCFGVYACLADWILFLSLIHFLYSREWTLWIILKDIQWSFFYIIKRGNNFLNQFGFSEIWVSKS